MTQSLKRKQTMLARYGVACPFLIGDNHKRSIATHQKRANYVFSTGETLSSFCKRNAISKLWARKIIEKYGEGALIQYVSIGQKKITSCEIKFIELMKEFGDLEILSKNPPELVTSRKADFCIELNKKKIFIVTESTWDSSKNNYYYSNLRESFEKTGNRIMMFYSNEVLDKLRVVKSLIKQAFKLNTKIKVAECEIRKIPIPAGEWFFREHSLVPNLPKFLTYYGILNRGRIMACFAIRKRAGNELHIDLFGHSTGIYVTDAVKIITFFLTKKYNPMKIIRNCNLRYESPEEFLGNGYVADGMHVGSEWTEGDVFLEKKTENAFKVFDMGRLRLVKVTGGV